MFDPAAPHVGFVIASYAVTAIVILLLLASELLRARKLKKALKDHGLHDPGSKEGA